jgi:hypothetical protein
MLEHREEHNCSYINKVTPSTFDKANLTAKTHFPKQRGEKK